MAKLIRNRKRKLDIDGLLILVAFSLTIIWLGVSLFLGTAMNSLTIEIQKIQYEIQTIKTDNTDLTVEISSLENKERIYSYAQTAGLNQDDNNVIAIKGE